MPLPTTLVDLLLSVSLAGSVLLLVASLGIGRTTQFLTFPSLLLLATLVIWVGLFTLSERTEQVLKQLDQPGQWVFVPPGETHYVVRLGTDPVHAAANQEVLIENRDGAERRLRIVDDGQLQAGP